MTEAKTPWMLELEELEKHEELRGCAFPFRGHRDFRGFTQDDYDNFPGGLWVSINDARKAKWFGGKALAQAAREKLEELGYAVVAGNAAGEKSQWVTWLFTPKSVPVDYQPSEGINL